MSGRYEKEIIIDKKVNERLQSLPSILTDYYCSLIAEGKSYATAKNYVYNIDRFIAFKCPNGYVEDFYSTVTKNDINRYIQFLRNNPASKSGGRISDSFLTTMWSSLNSFFQFLVPDHITTNPVSYTNRPKMNDNPEVTYLTQKEIATILKNVKRKANYRMVNRDLCILKLGFSTGLRVSALSQIDIDDIDMNNNTIRVIEKGNKSYDVLMGDNLKEQMLLWLDDRERYFDCSNTKALFVSRNSNRIATNSIAKLLKNYGDVVDKHITPHVMRHSCATNLYEKTGDIYLCAHQLNHKNVTTTQRYAEISNDKKQKAIDILDKLI